MELLKSELNGVRVIEPRKARFPGRNARAYRRLRTQIRRLGNEYLVAVLDGQQVRWQDSYKSYHKAVKNAAMERLNIAAMDWCKAKFGECYCVEFRGTNIFVEY
jgi:CTP synthase (UTP-ammonia lyase)